MVIYLRCQIVRHNNISNYNQFNEQYEKIKICFTTSSNSTNF